MQQTLSEHASSTTSGLTGAAQHVAMLLTLCSSWLQHHTLHMFTHHIQLITDMALSTMAPQPEEMVSSSGSTCSPCRQSFTVGRLLELLRQQLLQSAADRHSALQHLQTQLAD